MSNPSFKFVLPDTSKPLREMSEMSEDELKQLDLPPGKWTLRAMFHNEVYRIAIDIKNDDTRYLMPDVFQTMDEAALSMMYIVWQLKNPPN